MEIDLKINKDELKRKLDVRDGVDGSPDTGDEIVKKINRLAPLPPLQIDASHIKNLTSTIISLGSKSSSGSGSGTVGPGTINEIAYFDSTTTVNSLTVATYPSLTELSYVKGVTSAIQTQLGLLAPLASPTFTGTVIAPLISGSTAANGDITIQGTTDSTRTTSVINVVGETLKIYGPTTTSGGKLSLTYNDTYTSTIRESTALAATMVFNVAGSDYLSMGQSEGALWLALASGNPWLKSATGIFYIGGGIQMINNGGTIYSMKQDATTGALTIGDSTIAGTTVPLKVNNGTSTGNIFEAQDNGDAVFTVLDGGNTSFNPTAANQAVRSKTVTLTEAGGAENVITIVNATTQGFGLELSYKIYATDATDYAVREGSIKVACINVGGTVTGTLSGASEAADGSVIINTNAKTLTYAITLDVATANTAKVAFNIDSDMTVSAAHITWTAVLNGQGTIT